MSDKDVIGLWAGASAIRRHFLTWCRGALESGNTNDLAGDHVPGLSRRPQGIRGRAEWRCVFFDCPFDPAVDDYPDEYTVYRLPKEFAKNKDRLPSDNLSASGKVVGRVPIAAVRLDPIQTGIR